MSDREYTSIPGEPKEGLDITEVSYGETINSGNFQSRRIDATARTNGKPPEEIMTQLKAWVRGEAKK